MELLRQAARMIGLKNRQYETLTEITAQNHKVRIWRVAKSLKAAEDFNHGILSEQMMNICTTVDSKHWFEELMKLPNVACIAIVDKHGNGVSAYPDWH